MKLAGIELEIVSRKPLKCSSNATVETIFTGTARFVYKRYPTAEEAQGEANSLKAIAQTNTIRVPRVIASDESELLLEYIIRGGKGADFDKRLGKQLAQLHLNSSADQFGFYHDNFLGSIRQVNSWSSKWSKFFTENRLQYQFELAESQGYASDEMITLSKQLIEIAPQKIKMSMERPSLIHGNICEQNIIADVDGNPVLLNPAASYSDRQAEIGIMKYRENFSNSFYSSYFSVFPSGNKGNKSKSNWRILLYTLYDQLNHLNMFGSSYEEVCMKSIKQLLRYVYTC